VSIRSLGRWLYHAITSSDKRPYIESSLEELEDLANESSSASEAFRVLGIFDELTYRITSPERRDRLKTTIADQLLRTEGIRLPVSSDRDKVSEIRAQLLSRYAEKADAERKAKEEAAAEQARLEAEAKAQRAAQEKARKEAERKAKEEAAAEQARLEAEAKAKREEAERKEAERQAKEAAAAEQAGREEHKERDGDSTAAEPASEEEPLRQQDIPEEIKRLFAARPLTEAKQRRKKKEEPDSQAELSQPTLEDEENAATSDDSTAREAEELIDESNSDLEGQRARTDASWDKEADQLRQKYVPSRRQLNWSAEEIREERRELARLRRLEREGKEADQSEDELGKAELDGEFEEAEQFAPYLRAIPAHWSDWSEQHWNIKLLDYCFVQKANEHSSQGIPSTEEDLAFVTGDREHAPAEIAQALVDRVREFSVNRGLSPARLLIKRLETWDYKKPSPPRYFAFLWTTCLIAQGFPCPSEQGEFHKRYERDDVYGSNETQYLSGNLPAAWEQLSKWLDRDDIFDGHAHRRLILPKTDSRRSIISHSWKLSFPCRADRKRLHDLLGKVKEGRISRTSADLPLISKLHYQGGFTPEFAAALKQQIELVQRGNQVEEWLSAIIQREIESRGISEPESRRNGIPRDLIGIAPKLMLHLDDEDCYLELVLPGQSVVVDKPRRLSYKTYCAINLETKDKLPRVVSELDIEKKQEDMIIPELRVKIESEDEEYVLRLRHEGLDNAVLAEWSCEGLPTSKTYILFNSETNQIINDAALSGKSLCLLFRRHWDVVLSDGIEAESEEPISVARPRGWRLLELTKTSPLHESETISLTNATGEKFNINWLEQDVGTSNNRPLLKGLSLPGQTNGFVMLAESPELWLPPAVTDAVIEMYKIEDDEFFMPIGSIQVPSTESWHQAKVRRLIAGPGLYSVKLSYVDDLSERPRKWSRQILIAEEPEIKSLHPISLQARYNYKGVEAALDLERGVEPLRFSISQEFWNGAWQIHGLWPYEQILVGFTGDVNSFSQSLSADSAGNCGIPVAAFEACLNAGQSMRLSIKRRGFIHQYDLADLVDTPSLTDAEDKLDNTNTVKLTPKRSRPRGRSITRLELFYDSSKVSRARELSYSRAQEILQTELTKKIERDFHDVSTEFREELNGIEDPKRMVFLTIDFPGIARDDKEALESMVHQLTSSIRERTGTYLYAEWSRVRE